METPYLIDPGVPFPRPGAPASPDIPPDPQTPYIDPDMPGGKPLAPEPELPLRPEPKPDLLEPDDTDSMYRAYNDI